MIVANLKDTQIYRGIDPMLDSAINYMTPDFLATVGSQTQYLDGDKLYVTRFDYQTEPLTDKSFFEAHKRYLDIHLIMRGEERIDIADPENLEMYENNGDFYAYRGDAQHTLTLRAGDFVVVFPSDAHRIKLQANGASDVSKIVFKILVNY